jgi:hypothetical protein
MLLLTPLEWARENFKNLKNLEIPDEFFAESKDGVQPSDQDGGVYQPGRIEQSKTHTAPSAMAGLATWGTTITYHHKKVNHSVGFKATDGTTTNKALQDHCARIKAEECSHAPTERVPVSIRALGCLALYGGGEE